MNTYKQAGGRLTGVAIRSARKRNGVHGRPWRRLQRGLEALEDRRLLDGALVQEAVELLNASPALFVANEGQWEDASVRYAFHGSGAKWLHTDDGPVVQLFQHEAAEGEDALAADDPFDWKQEEPVTRETEFSVSFDGAQRIEPTGLEQATTVHNYFLGDQSNWRTGVPTYETVAYLDLYDGIDLYTWGRRDSLKYEFHVAPGEDYRPIQISYEGIEGLWLDEAGDLHVATKLGELVDEAPYIYQVEDGQQVEVAGEFALIDDNTFTFNITGDYDPNLELVIDPVLEWSTYFGGADHDYASDVAVDSDHNILISGTTDYRDVFVTQIPSDGGEPLWTTYLGGRNTDRSYDVAVDASDNVIVTGWTTSRGWVSGGYDTKYHQHDAFVAKLDSSGERIWSTYVSRHNSHDNGRAVAVDANGDVYVAIFSGSVDAAMVVKISADGQTLLNSTMIGSAADGWAEPRGIAVDSAGNVLLTGRTSITYDDWVFDGNAWELNGFDTTLDGGQDAFVVQLDSAFEPQWLTYLGGGTEIDGGSDIAVDADHNVFVTGSTNSAEWLSVSQGWQTNGYDVEYNGEQDAFVAKLSNEGDGLWATYLGGNQRDLGNGIAVDDDGRVLLTGVTESDGWVSGGFDLTRNGSFDAYVAMLSPTGGHVWSSYLGGENTEFASAPAACITFDPAGYAVVAGTTESPGWVSGGYDTTLDVPADAYIAKILIDSGPPAPGVTVTPTAGLITSEDETSDTFEVVLDVQPASTTTVAVDVSSNLIGEGIIEGAVDNLLTLTFDGSNWSIPRTVTITGVDDTLPDGDQPYTVQLVVNQPLTTDSAYDDVDPADVTATNLDNEMPAATRADAHDESSIYGSVSGSYLSTHFSDNFYEAITEERYAGNKRSRLEHQWSFDVTDATTFFVEAYGTAVEDFVFEYSVDGGSSWTEMVTVTKTGDDDVAQEVGLQEALTGSVLVQVRDTDRSKEAVLDTIFVDEMYFESTAAASGSVGSGDSPQTFLPVEAVPEILFDFGNQTSHRRDAWDLFVGSVMPDHPKVKPVLTVSQTSKVRVVDEFMTYYGQEREESTTSDRWIEELPWELWEAIQHELN